MRGPRARKSPRATAAMLLSALKLLGRALRANLAPALLIWIIGGAIVATYYSSAAMHAALEHLVVLRARYGILFPALTTAFFGGLMPVISQAVFDRRRFRSTLPSLHWILLFWFIKGVELDLFYQLQAWLWGTAPAVLAAKVFTDMFIYNAIDAAPTQMLFMRWLARRAGTLPATVPLLPRGWYPKLVLPILIMTWALWIPAVTMIYMMPLSLQVPLANLILWLWMLILLFTSRTYDK